MCRKEQHTLSICSCVPTKTTLYFFVARVRGTSPRVRFCCYAAAELQAWVRVVFEVVTEQTPVPKYLKECTLAPVTRWQEDLEPCDLSSFMPNYEAMYRSFIMPNNQAGLNDDDDDDDDDGDDTKWQMNLYVRGSARAADTRLTQVSNRRARIASRE